MSQPASFQNSPTSPTWRNTDCASSALLGRHRGWRRSPYHSWASFQPWFSERVPPRDRLHCWHQRSTCCSDRNRSMVRQVNATSLYQSRAGTAMWMIPRPEKTFPALTSIGILELQQPQEASILAPLPSIAGIPSASQMQFANQERLPTRTGNAVGIQENGAARHSSPLSCIIKAWL